MFVGEKSESVKRVCRWPREVLTPSLMPNAPLACDERDGIFIRAASQSAVLGYLIMPYFTPTGMMYQSVPVMVIETWDVPV